jgi:hypothetical protein
MRQSARIAAAHCCLAAVLAAAAHRSLSSPGGPTGPIFITRAPNGAAIVSYPRGRRAATMVAALSMAALSVAACTSAGPGTAASSQPHPFSRQDPLAARTQAPASATVVLPQTSADRLAAGLAQQLFRSAPVVVVGVDTPIAVTAAAAEARRIYAPLLLTAPVGSTSPRPAATRPAAARSGAAPAAASAHPVPGVRPAPAAPPGPQPAPPSASHPAAPPPTAGPATASLSTAPPTNTGYSAPPLPPSQVPIPTGAITPALRTEIRALHPRDVLAVGLPAGELAAELPGIRVVGAVGALPATTAPPQLSHVALLVPASGPAAAATAPPETPPAAAPVTPATTATTAMTVTAQVAGAVTVPVHGDDPRGDPTAITALAAIKPTRVLAAGAGFGSASQLAYRVAVAATGVQLPGGGQLVFPGHRLVALYGNPESPGLGALGEQDLPASIARARQMAAPYQALSSVPVVPAFEIIATVALSSPGPEGTYSAVTSLATLRPWVEQATAAGFYVILDLQPGRASLLDQAKLYEPLLAMPNVGLALDAEWKLQPGQLPLQQIGSVSITEVNSVVHWLAGLTAELHLPQKVLVLHQFRLSMIQDEQDLDIHNDDLAIVVHMDGQGTQEVKQETWDTITAAAPHGVFFGWKNFLVKDHPMLSPQGTMSKIPVPVMISYQ